MLINCNTLLLFEWFYCIIGQAMKKYQNVIGVTGPPGSGKTYLSRYIGSATGIEVIEMDKHYRELLNEPFVKFFMGNSGKKDVGFTDTTDKFDKINFVKKIEIELLKIIGNRMLKNLTKGDRPVIVDFALLPELPVAKKFGANYLVEGSDKLRHLKISEREQISVDAAESIVRVTNKIVDYNKLQYDAVINNQGYQGIPKEVQKIVEELNKKYNSLGIGCGI